MLSLEENLELDNVSLSDLDEMPLDQVTTIVENLESNTQWKDTGKNLMRNGAKMFGC